MATVALAEIRPVYLRYDRGELTATEAAKQIEKALAGNPKTAVIVEDVRRTGFGNDAETSQEIIISGVYDEIEATEFTTAATTFTLPLKKWETKWRFFGLANANATVKEFSFNGQKRYKLDTIAEVYVYGNALGRVNHWATFTPSSSGRYKFDLSYETVGSILGGTHEFAFYVEDSGGSRNRKVVETLTAPQVGVSRYNKSFDLIGGETYKIGFQTKSTAEAVAGGGYADFASSGLTYDRTVIPAKSFTVTKVA